MRGTLKPWLPLLLGRPVRGRVRGPGCGGTFTGFSIHSGDQRRALGFSEMSRLGKVQFYE